MLQKCNHASLQCRFNDAFFNDSDISYWIHYFINLLIYILQGGFDYKKAIVDTIITIIEENSEAKEAGL